MDKVAGLVPTERQELFRATADKLGMVPAAVEKDFWVCWVLMKIYQHIELSKQLLFKGGTSLSKCFGLIERFSEDIDLILDWELLTDEDPYAERSNTQQDKFNKAIEDRAIGYVSEALHRDLTDAFAGIGVLTPNAGKKELIFAYPKAFDSAYIRPEILIEISPMSAMVPKREVGIQCYAAKEFPAMFEQADISIQTIEARKTFWDKITILHVEAHRPEAKQQPERYSRHYYDIYQMLQSAIKKEAMADLALLTSVAEFKQKFYPQGWANYQAIIDGSVTLIPEQARQDMLKKDYEGMREMIHGDYPEFSQIMEAIKLFQTELNEVLSR